MCREAHAGSAAACGCRVADPIGQDLDGAFVHGARGEERGCGGGERWPDHGQSVADIAIVARTAPAR